MLCPVCGKELLDTAVFCTGCGNRIENGGNAAAYASETTPAAEFAVKFKKVLGSGLFLAIAILSTLNALMFLGVNIIADLTAIAMWMIYIAAKSEKHTCCSGLHFSAGIIKAKFILNWICISLLAISLAILFIVLPIFANIVKETEEDFNEMVDEIFAEMPEDFDVEDELDKILDEVYSDKDALKAIKEVEKELKLDLDRDSVEDMLDEFGYKKIENGLDWMSDNREGMLTKMVDTLNTVVLVTYSVALVLYVLINILVIGRLKNFASNAGYAASKKDPVYLNLTLLRSTLVTMGIFALAAPFAAAACFVGVALVNKIRREVIA